MMRGQPPQIFFPRTAPAWNVLLQDAFEVDSDSGEVRTARRLDRERRATHVFTVLATNDVIYDVTAHDRQEVDTADVTVYVDDVNDNAPTFVFPAGRRDVAYLSTDLANTVSDRRFLAI